MAIVKTSASFPPMVWTPLRPVTFRPRSTRLVVSPAPFQMLRGSRVAAGPRRMRMGLHLARIRTRRSRPRYRPSCLERYRAIIYLRFVYRPNLGLILRTFRSYAIHQQVVLMVEW